MGIKVGDIIIFKRNGLVSFILGGILKLFERGWDGWGWHVAFISGIDDYTGVMICEALAGGVTENPLSNYKDYRVYRWFDESPDQFKVNRFVSKHKGEKYDILVYPLTALAYLIRHYWGRPVPRLLDNSWSCWELVYYFCNRMGKPLAESYDFPMISGLNKILAGKEIKHDSD